MSTIPRAITIKGVVDSVGFAEQNPSTQQGELVITRDGGGPDIKITGLTVEELHVLKYLFADPVKLTIEGA